MGEIGGPRHYQGAGLGQPTAWICPGCGTQHTTRLEDGCAVCLAEDAQRDKAVAGAVVGVEKLAAHVVVPSVVVPSDPEGHALSTLAIDDVVRGTYLTEQARQSLAAALAHFVEHGSPDASLLPRAVMIGWARELAGLGEESSG